MLSSLLYILLQPEATGGAAEAASNGVANGGAAAADPLGCAGGSFNVAFILLLFGMLYFLLIRPQQKQARQHDQMLKELSKGDVVRTNGGIRGEVTAIDERDITLLISDRTRIKVLRSHIAGLEANPEGDK